MLDFATLPSDRWSGRPSSTIAILIRAGWSSPCAARGPSPCPEHIEANGTYRDEVGRLRGVQPCWNHRSRTQGDAHHYPTNT